MAESNKLNDWFIPSETSGIILTPFVSFLPVKLTIFNRDWLIISSSFLTHEFTAALVISSASLGKVDSW